MGISAYQKAKFASSAASGGTVTLPSTQAEGTFMLASVAHRGNCSVDAAPDGWTLLVSSATGTTSSDVKKAIYYKVAGPAEPRSHAWSLNATAALHIDIVTYRGVDTTVPPIYAADSDDTYFLTCPSVTTTVRNGRIIAMGTAISIRMRLPSTRSSTRFSQPFTP